MSEDLSFTEEEKALIAEAFSIIGRKSWQNSEDHGFHTERPFSEEVALFHSEVSEALEEWRAGRGYDEIHYTAKKHTLSVSATDGITSYTKVEVPAPEFDINGQRNKPEGIGPEFADILIRVFESAFHHGIPLTHSLFIKHEYNVDRPFKHGKIA